MLQFDTDMMIEFLYTLFLDADGSIECRIFKNEDIVKQYFRTSGLMVDFIQSTVLPDSNIFFGVLDRKQKTPNSTSVLWIDIDFKDYKKTMFDPEVEAILKLKWSDIPPSIIVKSGHGIHAYWSLATRLYDHDMIKEMTRKLAKLFNSDPAVAECSRIMRLPGTFNCKDKENIVPCVVLDGTDWGNIKVYDTAELYEYLNKEVMLPPVSKLISVIIENGQSKGGLFKSRSERDFAVVCELIKTGHTQDEIFNIFETKPIGDKYREKGFNKTKYLQTTIEAAMLRRRR